MPAMNTDAMPVNVQPSTRREPAAISPFGTLERFADEVMRIFDDFGLGAGGRREAAAGDLMTWAPRIDLTQHKDEVLIRADLPGVEQNDVKVTVTEDAVTIRGERHRAQNEERDGVLEIRVLAAPGAVGRPVEITG